VASWVLTHKGKWSCQEGGLEAWVEPRNAQKSRHTCVRTACPRVTSAREGLCVSEKGAVADMGSNEVTILTGAPSGGCTSTLVLLFAPFLSLSLSLIFSELQT
jgi:hypothetical protein